MNHNHRRRTKALITAALVPAALLAMAGCAPSEIPVSESGDLVVDGEIIADADLLAAAQEEGSFTIYSAVSEVRALPILDVFSEQVPGIQPEFIHLTGSQLFQRAEAEHGAGVLAADIIETTDKQLAADEAEIGIFEPYCPLYIDEFPDDAKEADCLYFSGHTGAYGIAYNSAMVDESDAPKSWADLLDPKWSGKIAMAQIGAGGSTWAYNLFLRDTFGIDYWEDLAAQKPFLTSGAGDAAEALGRGEVEVAILPPAVASASIIEGTPLAIVRPKEGLAGYGHYVGLADGAENANAAKVFLNWMSSKAGQTAVGSAGGDYSVRADVPGPVLAGEQFPTLEEAGVVLVESTEEYITKRDDWSNEWYAIFGYTP